MFSRLKRSLMVLLMIYGASANTLGATIFDWPEILTRTIEQLNKANSDIQHVSKVVSDIEAGRAVTVKSNEWADLSTRMTTVVNDLISAGMPTEFDRSAFAVSATALASCTTRSESLKQLEGYVFALRAAEHAGNKQLSSIDATLKELRASAVAVRYLIEVNAKMVSYPLYGDIFLWDWFDLESRVSKDIGRAESQLEAYRKRLKTNMDAARQAANNLQSNVDLLNNASCEITGKWVGKCVSDYPTLGLMGVESTLAFTLSRAGSSFICQMESPVGYSCIDVRFEEKSGDIVFKAQYKSNPPILQWTGRVAPNRKSMNLQSMMLPPKNPPKLTPCSVSLLETP